MTLLNWLLIVIGALFVLVEVAFGGFAGFDLVLIGSALVLGGGIGLATGSPVIGAIAASVLCLFYIAVGRRWVRARMHTRVVASNADAVVGRQGLVLQRIAAHTPGQVRVNDEVWRAAVAPGEPGPFEAGAVITVAGVDGVTLQVRSS